MVSPPVGSGSHCDGFNSGVAGRMAQLIHRIAEEEEICRELRQAIRQMQIGG